MPIVTSPPRPAFPLAATGAAPPGALPAGADAGRPLVAGPAGRRAVQIVAGQTSAMGYADRRPLTSEYAAHGYRHRWGK
jgi:hypothetical protein